MTDTCPEAALISIRILIKTKDAIVETETAWLLLIDFLVSERKLQSLPLAFLSNIESSILNIDQLNIGEMRRTQPILQ